MFRSNIKILFPFMLFFSLLVACSPSAKNELQYWENHKKAATEHTATYPAFKAVIEANMKEATPLADAAIKLKDEKQKAEKLKVANAKAQEVVGRITEFKTKRESLSKTVTKLAKLKLPKSKAGKRKSAMNAANEKIAEVDKGMAEATPADKAAALEVLKTQIGTLISAQGAADRALKSLKPKKAKKKKKKKKKKN